MDRYPPHRILITLLILFFAIGIFNQFATDSPRLRIDIPTDTVSIPTFKEEPTRISTPEVAHIFQDDRRNDPAGLEYPGGDTTVLNSFLARLYENPTDSVTILHFGDSQLEGDRITRYLRKGFMDDGMTRVRVINCTRRGAQSPGFGERDTILPWLGRNRIRPDLVILQYGLNMVRAGTSDFSFYRKMLTQQVRFLRKTYPALPVIMVGVSDMSYRKGEEIIPYSTVPSIIDAQRKAAAETGSAFWNLLLFMGGQGSGEAWFMRTEPLVRPDLCHFSEAGGEKVGSALYQAIKSEFSNHE